MSTEILKTEKFTVEKTVHRLLETCVRITERVTHLEKEFKEIREVSIKREQEIQTSLTNMREDLSRRIDETQVESMLLNRTHFTYVFIVSIISPSLYIL